MKVAELIERLRKLPQDLTVMGYAEDEEFVAPGQPVPIFEVVDVSVFDAATHRDDSGRIQFHFERSESSQALVALEMTLDY